ncbi:MAG: hypothetical protein M1481_07280 [Candidatus Thermoplasmatota archaeon]|nr:hypothetical protein [Candidatus Thermoplasmatota archaeon]MCL5963955.1 hypothetical protein [Candidatus Thermoplasmatota archaeon]
MIEVIDTSFLWALVDNEDENHQKAVEWIRIKAFGDLCILPAVLMEFQARYNFELNKLIAALIVSIGNEPNYGYDLSAVNRSIEKVCSDLSKKKRINTKKLNKHRVNLHDYCRKLFENKSDKMSLEDLKSSLTSLNKRVSDSTSGSIKILIETGYICPKIDGDSINKAMSEINDKGIKFDGTGDSMIAGELICLFKNISQTRYEFVSFDKDFRKRFTNVIEQMNISNVDIWNGDK